MMNSQRSDKEKIILCEKSKKIGIVETIKRN